MNSMSGLLKPHSRSHEDCPTVGHYRAVLMPAHSALGGESTITDEDLYVRLVPLMMEFMPPVFSVPKFVIFDICENCYLCWFTKV